MNYPQAQIGQLCLPTEQRDPRDAPDRPFKYVDISSIDKDLKVIVQTQEVIGKDAPSRARKVISADDVLVSTVRPNLNTVAVVPCELDGEIASTGFCVLRPNPRVVNARYLFYRALTQDFVGYLTARMRGANYPAVTDEVVRKATIPLPPLSEQQRIVEILDQADALRRKRAAADAKAGRILPALFVRMFGDPATNPKGWAISTLGDVTKTIHRYPTFYGQEYVESGVTVVRISDILPNHILSTKINRYAKVPKQFSDKFPLTILRSKDLVMAVRGDTTGKIGLVPDGLMGSNISPNLIRISPNSTVVNPHYFFSYMLLACSIFLVYITNTAKKSITAKNIKSIPIFIPPMSLQDQFGTMISRILIFDEHRLTSRNRLEELFSTLLHRAFSSELTVTWREAHMQELLAEIEQQAKWLTGENTRGSQEHLSLQQSLFRDEVPD